MCATPAPMSRSGASPVVGSKTEATVAVGLEKTEWSGEDDGEGKGKGNDRMRHRPSRRAAAPGPARGPAAIVWAAEALVGCRAPFQEDGPDGLLVSCRASRCELALALTSLIYLSTRLPVHVHWQHCKKISSLYLVRTKAFIWSEFSPRCVVIWLNACCHFGHSLDLCGHWLLSAEYSTTFLSINI